MRLDLACGNNKQEGFTGVDITQKGTQADIQHDLLSYPWPFEDKSVSEVFNSHYLEHIPHGNGYEDPFWDFFNELYRIMKPKATATFVTPYYASMRAFQDPTHMRMITEVTYLYLDQKWRKLNKLEHYPIKAKFRIEKIDHATDPSIVSGKSNEALQQMVAHQWNVVSDLVVTIKKV